MNKFKAKALAIALIASIFAFASCSDDDDDVAPANVPELVKSAFEAKYPGAAAKWENDRGMMKAEFVIDGKNVEAWFNADGTWVMSETDYYGELPKAVTDYIKANYNGYAIEAGDTEWIETPTVSYFRIELEQPGKNDVTLNIKADGTLVK